MAIHVDYSGINPVVKMPDRINLTNSSDLKDILFSLCEKDYKVIELDFSNVFSMDSSGLGRLIIVQKRLKDKGGALRIINVRSSAIMDLFQAIDLHRVFEIK